MSYSNVPVKFLCRITLLALSCSIGLARAQAAETTMLFRAEPPARSEARVVISGDRIRVEIDAPPPDDVGAAVPASCQAVFAGRIDPDGAGDEILLAEQAFVAPTGETFGTSSASAGESISTTLRLVDEARMVLRGAASHCALQAPVGGTYFQLPASDSAAFADCPADPVPCWPDAVTEASRASLAETELAALFLAAPQDIVPLSEAERRALLDPATGRLVALEESTGFLSISGDGGLPGFVMRVFAGAPEGEVIAISRIYSIGWETAFYWRSDSDSTWQDVSAELVPDYRRDLGYRLVPHGARSISTDTPVTVYGAFGTDEDGVRLATLDWSGGRFQLRD